MTRDEVIEKCPPLQFNRIVPLSGRKKIRIPTINIVDDIMELGWEPVETLVQKPGVSKNIKHAIVFNVPGLSFGVRTAKDKVIPQVILVGDNGHTPFRIYISFYRRSCNNRLIVPVKHSKNLTLRNFYISIRSKKYAGQALSQYLSTALKGVLDSSKQIFEFAETPLTESQKRHFTAMAYLRRKETRPALIQKRLESIPDFTIDLLLAPLREQDTSDNIWHILNRVQEKVIKGFKAYPSLRSRRMFKYKELHAFEKIIKINIQLYLDIYKFINQNG